MRLHWLLGSAATCLVACGLSVMGTYESPPDAGSGTDAAADVRVAAADGGALPKDDASSTEGGADATTCGALGATCSGSGVGNCCATLYCDRQRRGPDECAACRSDGSGCGPDGPSSSCCGGTCKDNECSR